MNKDDFKIGALYKVKDRSFIYSKTTIYESSYAFCDNVPVGTIFCLLDVETRKTGLFPESMGYVQLKILFDDMTVYAVYIQNTDLRFRNSSSLLEEVLCRPM